MREITMIAVTILSLSEMAGVNAAWYDFADHPIRCDGEPLLDPETGKCICPIDFSGDEDDLEPLDDESENDTLGIDDQWSLAYKLRKCVGLKMKIGLTQPIHIESPRTLRHVTNLRNKWV